MHSRGLACLVILIYHFDARHCVPGGWAAVDLFFILSGYLITSIILDSVGERHFFSHFIMRRGSRIWPVYYLCVFLIAFVSPILPEADRLWRLAQYAHLHPEYLALLVRRHAAVFALSRPHLVSGRRGTVLPDMARLDLSVGLCAVIPLSLSTLAPSVLLRGRLAFIGGYSWPVPMASHLGRCLPRC